MERYLEPKHPEDRHNNHVRQANDDVGDHLAQQQFGTANRGRHQLFERAVLAFMGDRQRDRERRESQYERDQARDHVDARL